MWPWHETTSAFCFSSWFSCYHDVTQNFFFYIVLCYLSYIHRSLESSVWKRPSGSPSPTINVIYHVSSLNSVTQCTIHTSLQHSSSSFLRLTTLFHEKILPHVQPKHPLAQLETVSSCPITRYLRKERDTILTATSFQTAGGTKEVFPQPPCKPFKMIQFIKEK